MGVSLRPSPVFATKVVRGLEGVEAMIKPCRRSIERKKVGRKNSVSECVFSGF